MENIIFIESIEIKGTNLIKLKQHGIVTICISLYAESFSIKVNGEHNPQI